MTWTIAVRVQSEIYNNARIRVAGQQLPVCGRSFSQSQNGKTLAWIIHVWQIPIGKIPHNEIPMESNINLPIKLDMMGKCSKSCIFEIRKKFSLRESLHSRLKSGIRILVAFSATSKCRGRIPRLFLDHLLACGLRASSPFRRACHAK